MFMANLLLPRDCVLLDSICLMSWTYGAHQNHLRANLQAGRGRAWKELTISVIFSLQVKIKDL